MEVKVRRQAVAGVANQRQYVSPPHPVPLLHADAARLEVGVERVVAAAEVEDHRVAVGLLGADSLGKFSGLLLGEAVDYLDYGAVGGRYRLLPVDRIAFGVLLLAAVDAAVGVELLPVDGVALGKPDPSVDRERRPRVAGGVATRVGRYVVRTP